ncbi:unnamed protein product, partial [Mycena citricolor]
DRGPFSVLACFSNSVSERSWIHPFTQIHKSPSLRVTAVTQLRCLRNWILEVAVVSENQVAAGFVRPDDIFSAYCLDVGKY